MLSLWYREYFSASAIIGPVLTKQFTQSLLHAIEPALPCGAALGVVTLKSKDLYPLTTQNIHNLGRYMGDVTLNTKDQS